MVTGLSLYFAPVVSSLEYCQVISMCVFTFMCRKPGANPLQIRKSPGPGGLLVITNFLNWPLQKGTYIQQ